jgi:hypothetical protein
MQSDVAPVCCPPQYDGLTPLLTTQYYGVKPGMNYTIKIGIRDVSVRPLLQRTSCS